MSSCQVEILFKFPRHLMANEYLEKGVKINKMFVCELSPLIFNFIYDLSNRISLGQCRLVVDIYIYISYISSVYRHISLC